MIGIPRLFSSFLETSTKVNALLGTTSFTRSSFPQTLFSEYTFPCITQCYGRDNDMFRETPSGKRRSALYSSLLPNLFDSTIVNPKALKKCLQVSASLATNTHIKSLVNGGKKCRINPRDPFNTFL